MVLAGFLLGILVGATRSCGPMAMAISLLILAFGFNADALLLMGLIGIMKGATVGGAVPAILFNTGNARRVYDHA